MEKGSMEGVLPMLGLFLIAFILAVQSLPISEALNDIAGDAGTEIGEIAETKAETDHIILNEIPMASKYSVNNAAYSMAEDKGGIDWQSAGLESESSVMSTIMSNWQEETTENFEGRINNIRECRPDEEIELNLYSSHSTSSILSTEFDETEYEVESDNIICTFNDQQINKTNYLKQESLEKNRYVEVAKAVTRFFVQIEEEYSEAEVDNEYVGEASKCGPFDDDDTTAEDNAHEAYNDDTPESDDFDIDTADGINEDWTITDDRDKYDLEDTETNKTDNVCDRNEDNCKERADPNCESLNATECSDTQGCEGTLEDGSFVCEEDDDEEPKCEEYEPIYEHEKNATISTTYTSIDFEVEDIDYRILAERNFERLSIEVDNFRFEWD